MQPEPPPPISHVLKRLAYRTGKFTLTSGKESNEYLDVKSALHVPQVLVHVTTEFWKVMIPGVHVIAGIATGSIAMAAMLATKAYHKSLLLTVRPEGKTHGIYTQVDGIDNVRRGFGDVRPHVILVEDVLTTGGSALKALDILKAHNTWPVQLLVVCDRQEGGSDLVKVNHPEVEIVSLTTLAEIRESQYTDIEL